MPSTPSSAAPEPLQPSRRGLLVGIALTTVAIVVAVTALAVASSDDEDAGARHDRVAGALGTVTGVGTPAPDFELRTLDGATVRLSELRGRPVIVNFWASWCHPCRKEFPELRRALRTYRDERLAVVGVSYEEALASDAREFAARMDATWPLARDPGGAVAQAWNVVGIPHSFFVAADGTLVTQLFGVTKRAVLEDAIERTLAA